MAAYQNIIRYTGAAHSFVVPAGCKSATFWGWGAGGAGAVPSFYNGTEGGGGSAGVVTVAVSPGDTITVYVGGGGVATTAYDAGNGASGGGATDIYLNGILIMSLGGGGGGGLGAPGGPGLSGTSGDLGAFPPVIPYSGGAGGVAGSGGSAGHGGTGSSGAGGGGISGAGGNGVGSAFTNHGGGSGSGAAGGVAGSGGSAAGGWNRGGAGGSTDGFGVYGGGGGGGGYSGGGGGGSPTTGFFGGGGGGSYVVSGGTLYAGTNDEPGNSAAVLDGAGYGGIVQNYTGGNGGNGLVLLSFSPFGPTAIFNTIRPGTSWDTASPGSQSYPSNPFALNNLVRPGTVLGQKITNLVRPGWWSSSEIRNLVRPGFAYQNRITALVRPGITAAMVPAAIAAEDALVASGASLGNYYPQPNYSIYNGLGIAVGMSTLSLSTALRAGWDFSLTIPPTMVDGSLCCYDPDGETFEAPWQVSLQDGFGGSLSSPPLICQRPALDDPRQPEGAPYTTISGCCLASYRMSRSSEDFSPTFRLTKSDVIVAAAGARAGVNIIGCPSWPVAADDYKQSTLMDILNGYCDSQGYSWYVDSSGNIQVVPWETIFGALSIRWWTKIRKESDKILRFTDMDFGKREAIASGGGTNPLAGGPQLIPYSVAALPGGAVGILGANGKPFAQQLSTPLSTVSTVKISPGSSGYIGQVAWWNGPPNSTGQIVGYANLTNLSSTIPITIPINGTPPITWVSFTVYNPVGLNGPALGNLEVYGTSFTTAAVSLPAVDPSFFTTYSSGELPIRHAQRWIDNRHQSKVAMDARGEFIVAMKRSLAGYRSLPITTTMLLNNTLLQSFVYAPPNGTSDTYRTHKITHNMAAEGPCMTRFLCSKFLI